LFSAKFVPQIVSDFFILSGVFMPNLTGKNRSLPAVQAAIDDLSYVASAFLSHIKHMTNWTGFMVLGGLKPDIGGNIAITS
jgi:hypothetical protein